MTHHFAPEAWRDYVLDALKGYWPCGDAPVRALPMARAASAPSAETPPRFTLAALPTWGQDAGVEGALLVPSECIVPGEAPEWERTDWLAAAFHLLDCTGERAHEARHGPIHSYSFRLGDWDARAWERAWVNRIALFLRRWAARIQGGDEEEVCGPRPQARILLTHDVDAVAKTPAIRLKQGAFGAFNAARELLAGRWREAARRAGQGLKFLAAPGRYDYLAEVSAQERARGLTATFHFYAGRGNGPRDWLFDPAYDVERLWRDSVAKELEREGHAIGLHPSFASWDSADALRRERARLEQAAGVPVRACRQHWLRFSWQRTWAAQAEAGLNLDSTLGFNDRPGFRNSAALQWRPWDAESGRPLALQAVPLLFMDSHFYDYQRLDDDARRQTMRAWLEEVRAVGGAVSVLWHPHTLAADYGWGEGFIELLDLLQGKQ